MQLFTCSCGLLLLINRVMWMGMGNKMKLLIRVEENVMERKIDTKAMACRY
ncbi:hypothetical protein ABFX02_04G137200 [Erythranthe guttata]